MNTWGRKLHLLLSSALQVILAGQRAAPCWTEAVTLTLLGEEGFLVERPQVQRSQVAEVTVTGVRVREVQLRLHADRTLPANRAPLDVLSSSPSFDLAFVEPQLPRGVLHAPPLLHTHRTGDAGWSFN